MWELFTQICLPIFVLLGLGWVIDRRFQLNLNTLVRLNLYVFVPAFIFVRVIESDVGGAQALRYIGFTLCVIGSLYLVSTAIGRLTGIPARTRKSLQLSSMFYNCGNYGIPLMTLAYPLTGPSIQVFALMTMNITTFSVGLLIASSQNDEAHPADWKRFLPVLRQPSIYAIAAALLARRFDLPAQDVNAVWFPLSYLADALVSFALITLGVQLSKTKPPALRGPLAWSLSLRLVGGPLIALGLTRLFGFDDTTSAILILGASAPTAVNTALIAHEFKADSAFAASAVFYSTLFSLVTVTIALTLLKSF